MDGLTEQWIYFLQNARRLESVPVSIGNVPAIQQAFKVANQANLSREELEDLESREMFIRDQRNAIVKDVKQGRTEGLKQGTNQTKIAIAQRLLVTSDDATITQITDLTLEQMKQLR